MESTRRRYVKGLIPTGWYPGAVLVSPDGKKLFVSNIKGHGSLSQPRAQEKGKNSHDHLGSVSIIDVPDVDQLAKCTEKVNANNRLTYSLSGLEKPRSDVQSVPVPARHGEPSPIKHVLYIIKENRTYDQVFGDVKEGNGDPNLVMFGEDVTPNQHALARQFTLFDNFYCSGVLSADGHTWTNEAYVSDYLERHFGGFTRSYPYEGERRPGFRAHWLSVGQRPAAQEDLPQLRRVRQKHLRAGEGHLVRRLRRLRQQDQQGEDHRQAESRKVWSRTRTRSSPASRSKRPTSTAPACSSKRSPRTRRRASFPTSFTCRCPTTTPRGRAPDRRRRKAMVADNDLALGRIVEAVSKSKFWNEDGDLRS